MKLPVIQQPWKMALGAPWIDDLSSGKLTISYWKLPFTVSFPIKKWWIWSFIVFCMFTRVYPLKMTNFHSYVKFPEGIAFSMTHKPNWNAWDIATSQCPIPPGSMMKSWFWWFQTWLDYFPYYIIWEVGCGWIFYSWLVISNMIVNFPFHIWDDLDQNMVKVYHEKLGDFTITICLVGGFGGFKHDWIIFHFIYGMSSFPLTNSYFSDGFWYTTNQMTLYYQLLSGKLTV